MCAHWFWISQPSGFLKLFFLILKCRVTGSYKVYRAVSCTLPLASRHGYIFCNYRTISQAGNWHCTVCMCVILSYVLICVSTTTKTFCTNPSVVTPFLHHLKLPATTHFSTFMTVAIQTCCVNRIIQCVPFGDRSQCPWDLSKLFHASVVCAF